MHLLNNGYYIGYSTQMHHKVFNMLKIIKFFFLFNISVLSFSQTNLVPNYSFEQKSHCPTNTSQAYVISDWFVPTNGSTDYFHYCSNFLTTYSSAWRVNVPDNLFGYQNPLTGEAYVGTYTTSQPDSVPCYRTNNVIKLTPRYRTSVS